MRTAYLKRCESNGVSIPAVADVVYLSTATGVVDQGERAYLITRIVVPSRFRKQGIGTELLKEMIAEAQKEGVTLLVGPQPYNPVGGMTEEELIAWFKRYGFTENGGRPFLVRRPEHENPQAQAKNDPVPQLPVS